MNWTGGSLQRHSKNAQKSIVSRQKEHFAKVRTALQEESPDAPASVAPFRPEFLHEDSGKLPPFGARSVRHAGHSRKHRHPRSSSEGPMPRKKKRSTMSRAGKAREASAPASEQFDANPHEPSARNHAPTSRGSIAYGEGGQHVSGMTLDALDADVELQLLEANRLRLLRESDWVGLGLSRPAKMMHFPSVREKDRIGKRRKVVKHSRQHAHARESITREPRHNIDDNHPGSRIAAGNAVEDIRIRIGTDALASQTPTQQRDESNREESSDPMLLDEEELDVVIESEPVMPSVNDNCTDARPQNPPQRMSKHGEHSSPGITLEQQYFHQNMKRPLHLTASSVVADHAEMSHGSATHIPDIQQLEEDALTSGFRLVGGTQNERICLTFDNPAGADDTATKWDDSVNPTVRRQANAGDPGSGQGDEGGFPRTSLNPTVEDMQWMDFLGIIEHSPPCSRTSSSHTPQEVDKSASHGYEPSIGPQNATLGDRESIGISSPISALLPCANRTHRYTAEPMSHVERSIGNATSTRQSHNLTEDERYWRSFALDARNSEPQSRVKTSRKCRTRVGVASSKSSSLLPRDESPPRHSERLQYTPEPTTFHKTRSSSFISNLFCTPAKSRSSASNPSDDGHHSMQSGLPLEAGPSVIHDDTSLFNDVSHATFPSNTVDHSLDHWSMKRGQLGPSSKRGMKRFRRVESSPVYDIPASDGEQ